MSTDWNQDSPEFILDHIRDAPEKQIQAIDTLDTKMIQIFVSASIVIGLAGLSSASGSERWAVVPLVLALLAYVSVAAVANNPSVAPRYSLESPRGFIMA